MLPNLNINSRCKSKTHDFYFNSPSSHLPTVAKCATPSSTISNKATFFIVPRVNDVHLRKASALTNRANVNNTDECHQTRCPDQILTCYCYCAHPRLADSYKLTLQKARTPPSSVWNLSDLPRSDWLSPSITVQSQVATQFLSETSRIVIGWFFVLFCLLDLDFISEWTDLSNLSEIFIKRK